jgi:hypothetical protein
MASRAWQPTRTTQVGTEVCVQLSADWPWVSEVLVCGLKGMAAYTHHAGVCR